MSKQPQIEPFLGRVPQPNPQRKVQPDRTTKVLANGMVLRKQPHMTDKQRKALDKLAGLTSPSSE